jgi:hypothetical protein
MPQEPSAIIWSGNPDKWQGGGGMESYIADPGEYVYWSTPPRQCRHENIRVGLRAYIWRTNSRGSGPRGIIAVGIVKEIPLPLLPGNMHLFARPERLGDPKWSEQDASSEWKTGIRIVGRTRFSQEAGMLTAELLETINPRLNILKNPRGTVFRVDAEQHRQIEALWTA